MIIDIATAFSSYPSGRVADDGTYNGESFRKNLLVPALREVAPNDQVNVVIDGVRSFGSSFLEEAFGGLIRSEGFTLADIDKKMIVICSKPHLIIYKDAIREYLVSAEKVRKKG